VWLKVAGTSVGVLPRARARSRTRHHPVRVDCGGGYHRHQTSLAMAIADRRCFFGRAHDHAQRQHIIGVTGGEVLAPEWSEDSKPAGRPRWTADSQLGSA